MKVISDEFQDDFEDNIGSDEFNTFVTTLIDLNLHMILNDPPITLKVVGQKERSGLEGVL